MIVADFSQEERLRKRLSSEFNFKKCNLTNYDEFFKPKAIEIISA